MLRIDGLCKKASRCTFAFFISVLVPVAVGCGGASYEKMSSNIETVSDIGDYGGERLTEETTSQPEHDVTLTAAQENRFATTNVVNLQRKIIYTTSIGLIVEDYKKFETDLPVLVSAHGGFVASNHTDRQYQDNQYGTWVIRIPVAKYNTFLTGVSSLGFAESRSEKAQDVTEEYVDVEARIKNKRSLEARIISILEERDGKLSEVLEIERELSRVREEIERMEGRLRFIKERTSLATVTINCREQEEYQPLAAPSLAARIGSTWSDSLGAMRTVAESLLILVIAIVPWITLATVITFIAYRIIGPRIRGLISRPTEATLR